MPLLGWWCARHFECENAAGWLRSARRAGAFYLQYSLGLRCNLRMPNMPASKLKNKRAAW